MASPPSAARKSGAFFHIIEHPNTEHPSQQQTKHPATGIQYSINATLSAIPAA